MGMFEKIAVAGFVGLGAYVVGQALIFKPAVGAWDYWEATGYINGLVRGAGSGSAALVQMNAWRAYWYAASPWAKFIIDALYNYGLKRIADLYGAGAGLVRVD